MLTAFELFDAVFLIISYGNSVPTPLVFHCTPDNSAHTCQSPTPTVNGCEFWFNSTDTDTNLWAGIQWLEWQQAAVNTVL